MNLRIYAAAIFFALSWGHLQASEEDSTEEKYQTVKQLQETVSKLEARIETLEARLSKLQVIEVAPELARSLSRLDVQDVQPRPQVLRPPLWYEGVHGGMMFDAFHFQHGFRR